MDKKSKKITSLIASGAIALGALSASANLPQAKADEPTITSSHSYILRAQDNIVSPDDFNVDADDDEDDGSKWKKRVKSVAKWLLTSALGIFIRLFVLLPLSILGKLLGWLLGNIFGGVAPFLSILLGSFISSFIMLLTAMTLLYHSLNSNKKFYKYFKPLNIIHIALTALALAAVNTGCMQIFAANSVALCGIYTGVLYLCVVWLWNKTLESKAAFIPRLGRYFISAGSIVSLICMCGICYLFVFMAQGVTDTSTLAFTIARGACEYAQCACAVIGLYLHNRKVTITIKEEPKQIKEHITMDDLEMHNTYDV